LLAQSLCLHHDGRLRIGIGRTWRLGLVRPVRTRRSSRTTRKRRP